MLLFVSIAVAFVMIPLDAQKGKKERPAMLGKHSQSFFRVYLVLTA
jgi:hypothetical protein